MKIRKARSKDRESIIDITRGVGNFTEQEIIVAMEVFDHSCDGSDEYITLCIDDDGVTGYASFGLIPLTKSSYDLYWIAVDKKRQQKGYGRILLGRVEKDVLSYGGDQLFIETSSEDNYADSRRFYERNGYASVATIKDFYHKGNDKIIYAKRLREEGA
jgi:ribosomal protein S18 acetylase RimI-like enzyme